MAHTSARPFTAVSALPSAVAAPVQNKRWHGRYPRNVTSIRVFKTQRDLRRRAEERKPADALGLFEKRTPSQELEHAGNMLAAFTRLRAEALQHYRASQQRIQAGATRHGATLYQMPRRAVGGQQ